jgi:hypothetical protein
MRKHLRTDFTKFIHEKLNKGKNRDFEEGEFSEVEPDELEFPDDEEAGGGITLLR